MISKEKGGMLNFWHPNYVEILYCIVRRHGKPLSTVYIYHSNSVDWSNLPIDKAFKQIAATFHLTLNECSSLLEFATLPIGQIAYNKIILTLTNC